MGLDLHLNGLSAWASELPPASLLRRAVEETLAAVGVPEAGEISVTFVPDGEIRALNRRWGGSDRPTDVLAFDLGRPGELLGDVYVAPAVAARNAAAHGVPTAQEVLRLVVHGVLHLLGHEHPEGEERYASEMFRLQERVIERLKT